MARTKATTATGWGEIAPDIAIETLTRGGGWARGQAKGRGQGGAPTRDYERGSSPEPAMELREEQVPHDYAAAPLL